MAFVSEVIECESYRPDFLSAQTADKAGFKIKSYKKENKP